MRITKDVFSTGLQRSVMLAVLAALALLWSALAWNHQDTERRALDEVRRETATLALLFANDVDSTFRSVDHALQELRSTWLKYPDDVTGVAKEYKAFLDQAILQMAIIGADGYLVYSDLGMPKDPTFLGEREHFKVHKDGLQDTLFVSRPLKGKVSGQWSIQLSRPIFRGTQFVGVVVISVDPKHFVKFYQDAGMGEYSSAAMVRDTGEMMARATEQDRFVGKVIDPSPYGNPGAPQQGSFRRKAQTDGVERLYSYHRLPQYGLTVVVGPSLDERLAPLHSQQRQTVLAAGLVTVLLLLVVWLLMRAALRKEAAHRALVDAEAATRDSNQRLSEVIWATHTGTWEWNVQTGATVFNERWAEIVGCTLAELAPIDSETWARLVHPEDGRSSADLIERCFSRELDVYECEARLRHKDGRWVWVSARGRVVEWAPDGKPLRMAGTLQDITERKHSHVTLVEFNRNFEGFLNQTSDFVYFKDRDSRFRFCSQTLAHITGHAHWRDLIGKHDSEVFPQDTAKIYQDEEAPVFSHGKPLLNKLNCRVPCDYVPRRSWPLFKARAVLRSLLASNDLESTS